MIPRITQQEPILMEGRFDFNTQKQSADVDHNQCLYKCVDLCYECIKRFSGSVEEIKKTKCKSVCTCNQNNINLNSNINLQTLSDHQLSKTDIAKMATEIQQAMIEKYGSDTKLNNQNLTNLLTQISKNVYQYISQDLISIQTVSTKGAGVNLSNISQDIVMNAVMKAIEATCSAPTSSSASSSECSMMDINTLIQEQTQEIQKDVDKSFGVSFKRIWTNLKFYIITIGVFLLVLVIIIIFGLVKKDLKK